MPRRLYRQERLDAILQELQAMGSVSVTELTERFGVSAVTVRSDLDELERNGRVLRTHGGAIPAHTGEGTLSFSVRQRENVQAKERIAQAAAELVTDGDSIVLDASTTAWHMARYLYSKRDLTVLTTGLYVALELLRSPSISVMVPGGLLWRDAASIVGTWDSGILEKGNLQKGFFGGRGLTLEEGLTDANPEEVALKRKLVSLVRQVNVLVDGSKFGKVAFASCALPQEIDCVITDEHAPAQLIKALQTQDVKVIQV